MTSVEGDAARTGSAPAFLEFITIIAAMMAMTALSIDVMLPALPAMAATLGVADPNDAQLIVTSYLLGFAAGQLGYGPLSDSFGRKPMLLVGLVVYALASLACFLTNDFAALLAARTLQGIGCAAPRVIAIAIVRDLFGGRQMARVMSFVMMVFIIVPILAPGIGEIVLLFGNWHWIFLFLFAASLLLMLATALRLPETRPSERREHLSLRWLGQAVWETVSNRQTLGYTIATAFVFGALMSYINSAAQIFEGIYDLGSLFPLVFAGIAASLAAAALLNASLVESIGMRRLSHGALMGFLVVAAIHVAVVAARPEPPPLALFAGLLGADLFFFGFIMPNFNAMAMEPLHRIAGTASSFIGCFTTGGAAVLGWFVGQQYDGTVLPLTLGYLTLSAIALAVVFITERGRLLHPQH